MILLISVFIISSSSLFKIGILLRKKDESGRILEIRRFYAGIKLNYYSQVDFNYISNSKSILHFIWSIELSMPSSFWAFWDSFEYVARITPRPYWGRIAIGWVVGSCWLYTTIKGNRTRGSLKEKMKALITALGRCCAVPQSNFQLKSHHQVLLISHSTTSHASPNKSVN